MHWNIIPIWQIKLYKLYLLFAFTYSSRKTAIFEKEKKNLYTKKRRSKRYNSENEISKEDDIFSDSFKYKWTEFIYDHFIKLSKIFYAKLHFLLNTENKIS